MDARSFGAFGVLAANRMVSLPEKVGVASMVRPDSVNAPPPPGMVTVTVPPLSERSTPPPVKFKTCGSAWKSPPSSWMMSPPMSAGSVKVSDRFRPYCWSSVTVTTEPLRVTSRSSVDCMTAKMGPDEPQNNWS